MNPQLVGAQAASNPVSQWEAAAVSLGDALRDLLPGLVRDAVPDGRHVLLRKADVAKQLAVSERMVDKLVAAQELRPVSIGRARRFVSAQVDAYVRGLSRRR